MPDREAWDMDAFVRHYNELAREFGGWNFDPDGPSPEKLEHWYESTTLWESLQDFAKARYALDQQV